MKNFRRLLVKNMDVGVIKSVTQGKIFFEPYRGSGHYELVTTMESIGICNGVLIQGEKESNICIIAYPEYGLLEFTTENL